MTSAQSVRPNIVYINSHDTGRYVEPYGYGVPMPNYQRFAEEGTLFRRAFCAGPTCSPSRAALLTGQCPHASGMLGLAHRGFRLNDPFQHLAWTLKQHGYFTALCGGQHVLGPDDFDQVGYSWQRSGGFNIAAEAAMEFLAGPPAQPFYLEVGFFETHRDGRGFSRPEQWCAEDEVDARFLATPASLPDTDRTRRDMADYCVSARRLDRKVGAILQRLDDLGLREDTLVIVTTDHGIAFPGMKCSLTDRGIGVCLMMRGPGGFAGGRVCDALVSQIDIYPTLCELLGIERPQWLQGTSLLPLVRGEVDEINEAVFAEVTFHAAFEPKRCVRTGRWKYIRNYGQDYGQDTPVLPNCDDSPSKDQWLEAGWRDRTVAREELYDVTFDPIETNNLALDPGCAAVLREMNDRLDSWMAATHDPLLTGQIPVPAGVSVNPAHGLSPGDPPIEWPHLR